ncbi:zinc finger protein AEBP2-like isoform X1 [Acipenser ruthenus]|uniref:zinc finger protein AEBP2-like isoform X1 n=1 Tax=Acipenser ruthenus TaxID=7906 RepID=UPI002740A285|nr:zinc finger protein AEBP2-like isoform X1 [Acipenser ruthenus]
MAATSSDSAEQDSPSPSNENGATPPGETEDQLRGLQLPQLKQSNQEKMEAGGEGNGEREVRRDGDGKAAAAEEEDEEEEIGSVSAGGEEETSEQQSPASSSETGDGPEKEIKQEQREECESVSGDGNEKSKAAEDTIDKSSTTGGLTSEHANKRRASVEISSSDGEPLSRMDSEDSISSTLMDMDSTASSGRSTPAMMNGQGSTTPSTKSIAYNCCWDQCQTCFNSSPDLAEHIRSFHVDGQRGGVFVCLWKGCKVYNTPSTSQSWLQRHMLTHSGDKPFKCVVGGCNASFASQGGLARHVPTHFSQQNSSKVSSQPKVKEESPSKACLNKRKRLKNKRRRSLLLQMTGGEAIHQQVTKARPHDFFDAQTMDAIRHRAICLNLATHIESLGNGHSVVFHSTVIARRKEDSGKVKILLHWTPEDILPDVWVNENDRPQLKTKVVHLSKLPQDTAVLLDPNIYRTLPQKRLKRR